ncbi:hypothetical protein VTN02DRAFT_4272 [Thermoascus thermophilus]
MDAEPRPSAPPQERTVSSPSEHHFVDDIAPGVFTSRQPVIADIYTERRSQVIIASAMQVAEVLSDLTSLRACGHKEALALVSVHKPPEPGPAGAAQSPDLQRARDLIDLHYGVKVKHVQHHGAAVDEDLRRAREDVNRVLAELR